MPCTIVDSACDFAIDFADIVSATQIGRLSRCLLMKNIAIIVFVPNQEHLIEQFFGLYYSVMLHPGLRNNADFIIGCSPEITHLFDLDNCVLTHTNEISKLDDFKFKNRDNEYGYINSWSHFLDRKSVDVILEYPYALRIDVDTFLSPSILDVVLAEDEIMVGQGGYMGGQVTTDNLLRIAKSLGFKHRGLHNLGSTWFTHSHIMVSTGCAAIDCARYIMYNEFLDSIGSWPEWFAGVTSLYAGELVLNQSPYLITQTDKFDAPTTKSVSLNDVYSLHAWHTDKFYSKHAFMAGKYDDKVLSADAGQSDNFAFLCARSGKILYQSIKSLTR